MKGFKLLPTSNKIGVIYVDGKPTSAVFITLEEAKFMATFKTVQAR